MFCGTGVMFIGIYYPEEGRYKIQDAFVKKSKNPAIPKEELINTVENQMKELGLNLRREPPIRSRARGFLTRFEMDKLDGINVYSVLSKKPSFYHQDEEQPVSNKIDSEEKETPTGQGDFQATVVEETEFVKVTEVTCRPADSDDGTCTDKTTVLNLDCKTGLDGHLLGGDKKKRSVRKRVAQFFRKLMCF